MFTRLGYFTRETLVSLRRNLLMTIAGILTVAVSLALFGGIMMLSRWVGHGTEQIKGGVRAEIFMTVHATKPQIDEVNAALKSDPQVASFRFLDKPAALREFKSIFRNDPDLVKNITADALPTSFRVVPKKAEYTSAIKSRYSTHEGVDSVVDPGQALRDLLDATNVTKYIFIGLSIVLLASSLFLIVNTIRLATYARRREIEVMKLVGASNWFVRVPFMAEGLVQGLIGAGLAIGSVIALKLIIFDDLLFATSGFFRTFFVTSTDTTGVVALVLLLGMAIGLIGSAIGLRRFLRV
jgi:cell division transport system permease protein